MRFEVTQRLAGTPEVVAAAYTEPELFERLAAAPDLGAPEVLSRDVTGNEVRLRVRYRFTGDLSSAARAVLDPDKLTWIESSVHDLANRTATFELLPDNYADRFTCSGDFRFEPATDAEDGTLRVGTGDVKVRAPLVASTVERALISGLKEHLAAEAEVVAAYLAER